MALSKRFKQTLGILFFNAALGAGLGCLTYSLTPAATYQKMFPSLSTQDAEKVRTSDALQFGALLSFAYAFADFRYRRGREGAQKEMGEQKPPAP